MTKLALKVLAPAALAIAAFAAPAQAADLSQPAPVAKTQPYSQVGVLKCEIDPAIGVILGSRREMQCVFQPANKNAPSEVYSGRMTKVGVDLGYINGGNMVWAVWAPTTRPEGALDGRYVGASANAAIGIGAGSNILTGGSWKTISLQPISLQGQKGLNVAVGVSNLRLKYKG